MPLASRASSKSRGINETRLKAKHPGEWILLLKNGEYVHAKKLDDAYAKVSDVSQIVATLRPYKSQELLLY